MNIDKYLEYRAAFIELGITGSWEAILALFPSPLGAYFDWQKTGNSYEFTPASLPFLNDYKQQATQLIKARLKGQRLGCDRHSSDLTRRLVQSVAALSLDEQIDKLLDFKINNFLANPKRPRIFKLRETDKSNQPEFQSEKQTHDSDALAVWQPGAGSSSLLYAVSDCTESLLGFLYVDCGRQSAPDNGYCFMPLSHDLANIICGDTLEEAKRKLNAFQCQIERLPSRT